MPPVEIYIKPSCPYCVRAEALLQRKGVAYKQIVASTDPDLREEMIRRSGRMTYPQIFIDGTHVGGCDDLHELERRGELDRMLGAAA